ncbi:Molybdenum transport system permease protein ModB [bioreactor metagenome]|uniref:Molybdenum transport system permease protein ModB n=1 Tax=bioreactor metagenome TaxID=1076179 RepID=A0A644TG19_9ZZZZ
MIDMQPVYLSIKVAGAALVFVAILGTAAALIMHRCSFPGKAVIEALFTMPLVLPPVVTGFILLLLIGKQGPIGSFLSEYFDIQIIFTPLAAVLAAIVVAFPMMYQSAKAAFKTIDPNLEDVARTLGASEGKIVATVTLPLALPGLAAGAVLSFARALGEFGATIMVAGSIVGKTQTIPLAIYFAAESNDLYTAGGYVLIIAIITFAAVLWVNRWHAKTDLASRKDRVIC